MKSWQYEGNWQVQTTGYCYIYLLIMVILFAIIPVIQDFTAYSPITRTNTSLLAKVSGQGKSLASHLPNNSSFVFLKEITIILCFTKLSRMIIKCTLQKNRKANSYFLEALQEK